jgi:MoaA/NifB/PqqE/SkfB family radical SAM enzyme
LFNAAFKKSAEPSMSNPFEKPPGLKAREESLSIEVTTRCNCECTHCFARVRNSESADLCGHIAKEIVLEGYGEAYRHLHITGGEPLLWENLLELLDYAFDVGYQSVFLNSNGTLLTKDISKRLAAYDGISISISLEGSQAFHDNLRGENSYRQAVNGIETALAAGLNLYIFATACKSLLPNLPHFVESLYKKFSTIRHLVLIQLFSITNDGFACLKELLEPQDFIHLVRIVAFLNLYGFKTSLLNNPLAGVAAVSLKMPWVPQSHPLYRDGSLIVMANRDIRLSHSSRDSLAKYESGRIQEVLASEAYRKAVAPDQSTCPSCEYFGICNKNGMVRPSQGCWNTDAKGIFCKRVLDNILVRIPP